MKTRIKLDPTQILVMGFAALIIIGAVLLSLPAASPGEDSVPFLDCFFTATSAVCVTGLVVRDTATQWTAFGQITILFLIQVGGLGFMTMATMIMVLMGRRIRLRERLVIQEALNEFSMQGVVLLIKRIIYMTFSIELLGAAMLSIRFIPQFGFPKGLFMSIFHSISAFCNAGFDLMGSYYGPFSSFTGYTSDWMINLTLMALIIVGGLGFTVLLDLGREKQWSKLSLHSKVVLSMTAGLLLIGFAFFFTVELGNPATLGNEELNGPTKVLAAFFQSVTTRTAGFNTITQDGMTTPSKLMSVIMMFIGASPAGTGGGIKTTTFAIVILMVLSVSRGREDITIYNRRVNRSTAFRALAVSMIAFFIVVVVAMVLSLAERGNASGLGTFENILFESVSAFATVGLSAGITPSTSTLSRIFTIITMFIGRVGPLTLALALIRRQKHTKVKYSYPEGKIMVG